MLATPFSLVFISLSLLFSHEARAAVLKSPRTVDLNALSNTPTTLSPPTSVPLAYVPPALPSSSVAPVNNSTIAPLHQEGQQPPPSPSLSPPPPSPPSTLALAVETSTAAFKAAEVDMGNIPYEESVTTATGVPAAVAAAAAAEEPALMRTTAAPSPPPVDEDAAREFQEAYGDRYTQTTYWSCQTEGVFKGHCGWHEPIIEIAAAASSGAGERRHGHGPAGEVAALALALRACVVAAGAVVVGGAIFAF